MTCRPGVAGGPMSLPPMELPTNEGLWTYHQIRKGVQLAHAGSTPASLFVVTVGCFRVSMPDGVAQGRVLDFAMRGDWLGTEALAGLPWHGDVIALEDSQVRVMPVRRLEPMASSVSGLREALYRHFVGTMLRDRNHIVQLGVLNARQRLALFLLDLSERFAAAGAAADVFELPMLRADIGSYLGLALESVSRAFSALQQQGVIRVRQRRIELRDMPALRSLAMEGPIVPVAPEAGTPIAQ